MELGISPFTRDVNAVNAESHILELFSLILNSVLYCINMKICDIAPEISTCLLMGDEV